MRPKEWINHCQAIDRSPEPETNNLVAQFEALIIPYLLASSKHEERSGSKAIVLSKLRTEVIAKVRATVENIKLAMNRSDKDCHQRITDVQTLVRQAIHDIRTLSWGSLSYFPFVLEFEMDEQTDIPTLTARLNKEFQSIIGKLSEKPRDTILPLYLIPDGGTLSSAINNIEADKDKLLSKWAGTDRREYGRLLNKIMNILMKQAMFIYVSQLIRHFSHHILLFTSFNIEGDP